MTDWLARRRALVWLLAIGLAATGAVVATRLPSGIYPEVEFPAHRGRRARVATRRRPSRRWR